MEVNFKYHLNINFQTLIIAHKWNLKCKDVTHLKNIYEQI